MSRLTEEIARQIEERASVVLVVEEDAGAVVLDGMVSTEEERQAALDIARELADAVVDGIEVLDAVPEAIADVHGSDRAVLDPDLDGVEARHEGLEPGDFTDQATLDSADEAAGPRSSIDVDLVADGDEVYVPPVDPVTRGDQVLNGLEQSSMDSIDVDASADGTLGDEAIHDAVLRELAEDAATTNLDVRVAVLEGVVRLSGEVQLIEDAENAQEVAARVPGVVDVVERCDVPGLTR